MKMITFAILILASHFTYSQAKWASNDPCYKNTDSNACRIKMSNALFFLTHVDGKVRPEYISYVNAYYAKYGIEGFKVPSSQTSKESLFIYALETSKNPNLNSKLIKALPKGEKVDGKNIFDIIFRRYPAFRRESNLKAYIENLNTLFPIEGNDDFQKTKEQFGLPWEDPSFIQAYVNRVEAMIQSIDAGNAFFKRNEFQKEKKEFQAIIERIKKIEEIPAKTCATNNYEEYIELKNKYGELLDSPKFDSIGCMIKTEKYDLVQEIVQNSECGKINIPSYFDQAVAIKETPQSFRFSQFLYQKISECGLKINPVQGEARRDFLQRGSVYLNKYNQEELICDTQIHTGKTLEDLSKNLDNVLYVQAYQMMEKILKEKDSVKKSELIDQFAEVKIVGTRLSMINPASGKTLLHLMAEAGDTDLLNQLSARGVHSSMIGNQVLDKNGKTPFKVAIEAGRVENRYCP